MLTWFGVLTWHLIHFTNYRCSVKNPFLVEYKDNDGLHNCIKIGPPLRRWYFCKGVTLRFLCRESCTNSTCLDKWFICPILEKAYQAWLICLKKMPCKNLVWNRPLSLDNSYVFFTLYLTGSLILCWVPGLFWGENALVIGRSQSTVFQTSFPSSWGILPWRMI